MEITNYTNSLRIYFLAFVVAHVTAFCILFPVIAFIIFVVFVPFFYITLIYAMVYNYCKKEGINFPYEKGLPVLDADAHMIPFYYLNDYDPFIDYFDYDPRY